MIVAIDVFNFGNEVQGQPSVTLNYNVTTAKYGDGYSQVSENGINSELKSVPVTVSGTRDRVLSARDFIRKHVATPFLFTDILGEQGVYIPDSSSAPQIQSMGGGVFVLTATFVEYPLGGTN